jgi:hypothetical protein
LAGFGFVNRSMNATEFPEINRGLKPLDIPISQSPGNGPRSGLRMTAIYCEDLKEAAEMRAELELQDAKIEATCAIKH